MSIEILGDTLNFKTVGQKYITTYISDYSEAVDTILDRVFNAIFPFYESRKVIYSNVCGANAEYICKHLKIDGVELGKIIITNWKRRNVEVFQLIASVYGPIRVTIGASYHALVYLEIIIDGDAKYQVAIETTICEPYKLQFYVGTNEEEFEKIIQTRYHCFDFKISYDCEKKWEDIAYRGGRKRKTRRRRRNRLKKHSKSD